MVVIIAANLTVLGSSRLRVCIRTVAVQGIATGLLPLVTYGFAIPLHWLLFAAATISLKGVVFPLLLTRAMRSAGIQREVEPLVSYPLSIMAGIAFLIGSFWLSTRLPLPIPAESALIVPVTLSTILTGLFVLASRVKALTQVLGYLVLENGIYSFGEALLHQQSVIVEFGILLDVFVSVFVMGIAIFHISREFDHIDTQHFTALTDWTPPAKEAL